MQATAVKKEGVVAMQLIELRHHWVIVGQSLGLELAQSSHWRWLAPTRAQKPPIG
jgi:hypothetical protein